MYTFRPLSLKQKINILTENAKYDLSCSCGEGSHRIRNADRWFYPAVLPNGRTVILLKILQTTVCENDCKYCPLRKDRKAKRTYISPEELAKITYLLYKKKKIMGLFLSSGVIDNPIKTETKMIDTVKILRKKYNFKGYIHLKILPNVDLQSIETAIKLSTRVSLNLESPTHQGLKEISSKKDFYKMLKTIKTIDRILKFRNKGSMTTQFIVGAGREKDKDYVDKIFEFYNNYRISRIYFSAFQPIQNTPLENKNPASPIREHRLYQVDFLVRKYGFSKEDIIYKEDGNLDLGIDPKLVWVKKNLNNFPIEINSAPYDLLLRIPGIGPKTAKKIIKVRKKFRISSTAMLIKLGVSLKKSSEYVLIDGKKIPVTKSLF